MNNFVPTVTITLDEYRRLCKNKHALDTVYILKEKLLVKYSEGIITIDELNDLTNEFLRNLDWLTYEKN